MELLKRLAALALLLALAGPAHGEAKHGIDLFKGDTRFAQRVTLEAHHLPVETILRQLTERTQVPLAARGEAADLRVTAVLIDQPLVSVLSRLSTLLHLTWSREDGGETPGYVLSLTVADRQFVEVEKAREWARFRANVRRILHYAAHPDAPAVDTFDSAAKRIASQGPVQGIARVAAGLPDSVLEHALTSGSARIPFGALTPFQQQTLRSYVPAARRQSDALREEFAQRAFEKTGVPQERPPRAEPPPLEQSALQLTVIRRAGDGQRATVQLQVVGEGGARAAAGVGVGIDPSASLSYEEASQLHRHFLSREVAPPRDPPLKLLPIPVEGGKDWEEVLLQFARENRVSVLSDVFDPAGERAGYHLAVGPVPDALKPEQLLDRLCMAFDYTWNAGEPLMLFRRRDWFLAREGVIPESAAARWRETARQHGAYSLDDLAAMAAMSEGQRGKLWKYAGMEASRTVHSNREVLLFLRTLRPEQRRLSETKGVTPGELSLPQKQALASVLARVRPEPQGLQQALIRVEVAQEPAKAAAAVTLVFRDGQRRARSLDCKASPAADPWRVKRMPVSGG
jgi:hypothetical protein